MAQILRFSSLVTAPFPVSLGFSKAACPIYTGANQFHTSPSSPAVSVPPSGISGIYYLLSGISGIYYLLSGISGIYYLPAASFRMQIFSSISNFLFPSVV